MLPYLRATEHGELCQEDIVKVVVLKGLGLVYTPTPWICLTRISLTRLFKKNPKNLMALSKELVYLKIEEQ